jgi:hypothetical protein
MGTVKTITLDFTGIMSKIASILDSSDWIYDEFHKDRMSERMVFNLTDVLGRLDRHEGPAEVYIKTMQGNMDEMFKTIRRSDFPYPKFRWVHVHSILGQPYDDGSLACFMTILQKEPDTAEEHIMCEMFARLVVCCLFSDGKV